MAADERPSTSSGTKGEDSSRYNPKLDFFSDEFDPLEALKSEKVELPCPSARIYDNLSTWNQQHEGQNVRSQNRSKTETKQQTGQRRWLEHQLPIHSTKHIKQAKNIFTKMEAGEGVFKALRKYKDEKTRIKVVTRDDRGIRGYCIATLLAFDKHWNLLLKEVNEVWTRRKKYKVPVEVLDDSTIRIKNSLKPPKVEVTKSGSKSEECKRFIYQMIMRGEDVVLITPLNNSTNFEEDLELIRKENEKKSAFRESLNKFLSDYR